MGCEVSCGNAHRKLESLFRLTPLAIIEWDAERRVTDWNPAAERMFEYPRREALGRRIDDWLFIGGDIQRCYPSEWEVSGRAARCLHTVSESLTRGGRVIQCSWHLAPLFDAEGRFEGVLSQVQDVTTVRAYRQRLHALAFFDALTGLANRALFADRLKQTVAVAARESRLTGVMVLGLDGFRKVNEAYGHAAGDAMLKEVAERLQASVRPYDSVARVGADEFAFVLPDIRYCGDLGTIAHKLLEVVSRPFSSNDGQCVLSASIGIALFPRDGNDGETLLRFSESALHHAQQQGRGGFRFYSSELTDNAIRRLTLETGLRGALANGELDVHFQPQVDLGAGRLVGAEALLRWFHPGWGKIPPDQFVGIAEDTGLIVEIGAWVLRRACGVAAEWNRAGQGIRVAVNLSARQFVDDRLADVLAEILVETACRPEWLEVEITESLLLENSPSVRETLRTFAAMGIGIAIDDFGTGHSALSYIKHFHVTALKIDRSFILDVTSSRHSADLVLAIIALAHSLRLQVVAEGVETVAQEAFLKAGGCRLGQGYLYGRPMAHCDLRLS